MKEQLKATTRRMIPILAQIVQRYLPGHKIEELAAGEEIKAREFSYSAFGENQNAVEWQIWAAMLTHLVLRYIKWKNKVVSSYTRFAAIIKNTIWLKCSLEAVINFYCIAPGEKCENIGFWRMA